MPQALQLLFALLIAATIGNLVAAILLRAAAQWVLQLDVPFGNAYVTLLLASFVNLGLGFVVGLIIGAAAQSTNAVNAASLFMLPVGFCVQSGFISSRLRITFGKACLVSLVMIAVALGIGLVVGGIIFGLMKVTA